MLNNKKLRGKPYFVDTSKPFAPGKVSPAKSIIMLIEGIFKRIRAKNAFYIKRELQVANEYKLKISKKL